MPTKEDKAFGIIPFIKEDGGWKVFLIHDCGSRGDSFWGFPKGHAEGNESPIEAAKRELFEETGINLKQVKTEKELTQNYTFTLGEDEIVKEVTYFVGVARSNEFSLQTEEVKEANWFSPAEALQQLTHDSAKDVLKRALEVLKIVDS